MRAVVLIALFLTVAGRCSSNSISDPVLGREAKSSTICLTFHDIVPDDFPGRLWFDCTESEFKDEIRWLTKAGAHFISVPALYRHLTAGSPLPPHPVCLTFADNYLGFYQLGYPLLKRLGIPCAMFVHTGYVGSPIGRPKMDWAQLQQLSKEGLCLIESQTVTHPADLRSLSDTSLRNEMIRSKQDLESHLHGPAIYLAYPNGKYDPRCERAAKAAGYSMAFTEVLDTAERSPNIFAVNRYVHTKFHRAWRDAAKG